MKKLDADKNKYLRYSGMAFELLGLLLILTFIGRKIDAYFAFEKEYITAAMLFFGLIAYLYKIVKVTSK